MFSFMPMATGAIPQLNWEEFTIAFDALQSGEFDLAFGCEPIKLGQMLGSGGTKEVYDSRIEGEPMALALPNQVDDASTAFDKWQHALREPSATDAVRNLGLVVNTQCRIQPITVSGTPLPVLCLTRYQDLPVEVRDCKNKDSSIYGDDIFGQTPTVDDFISASESLIVDTTTLVREGVQLGADSFNLCRDANGVLRLYLNDLADAELNELSEQEAVNYAAEASRNAVGSVIEGLSWDEYERHQKFFRGGDFHYIHGQVYRIFTDKVMGRLGLTS